MTEELKGHLPDCEQYSVCETCDCAEIKLKARISELEAALIGVLPHVKTSREAAEFAAMERQCTPALDAVAAARAALKETP
jgi:hypothetical protein